MPTHANTHYRLERSRPIIQSRNATDPLSYWFTAAVVFAFLTAGIITCRTSLSGAGTGSFAVAAAQTQSNPMDFPPTYVHVEGIDP